MYVNLEKKIKAKKKKIAFSKNIKKTYAFSFVTMRKQIHIDITHFRVIIELVLNDIHNISMQQNNKWNTFCAVTNVKTHILTF